MKTTLSIDIDDSVMLRLREEAARRGATMSALAEAGIRSILDARSPSENQTETLPPLPSWSGGRELVDIANRDQWRQAMEER